MAAIRVSDSARWKQSEREKKGTQKRKCRRIRRFAPEKERENANVWRKKHY